MPLSSLPLSSSLSLMPLSSSLSSTASLPSSSSPFSYASPSTVDSKLSLELTDGWYKIHACIDPPLQRAIIKSKIQIGSKLEICGAKIYGESVGKTPVLDATRSVYLKLSGNWLIGTQNLDLENLDHLLH